MAFDKSQPTHALVLKLRHAQRIIAERVSEVDSLPSVVKTACGVDVSYAGPIAAAAAVVVDAETLKPVAKAIAILKVEFPYIPTLLAFREARPMVAAVSKLGVKPDVLIVDGNGRLHPLGAGVACQVGVALDMPTIGIAKKLLCGEMGEWINDEAPVKLGGKIVGIALRKGRFKPIYVSVGHRVSLRTAVKLVKRLTRKGFKLPEPLRLAHLEATAAAKRLRQEVF